MLHPYALIREKCPNKWQGSRVEWLVLVRHKYCVVMQGSPATDAFIMTHPDFPNKELYDT